MAKQKRTLRDFYRGIRKPVPPPGRVEKDRRETLREREDRREMEEHRGRDRHRGEE